VETCVQILTFVSFFAKVWGGSCMEWYGAEGYRIVWYGIVLYGMEWYGSVQHKAVGYATVLSDMVSKIFLVEFFAKLARFGLAGVNFYALSVIQSAMPSEGWRRGFELGSGLKS
jgi:hypothetical protein